MAPRRRGVKHAHSRVVDSGRRPLPSSSSSRTVGGPSFSSCEPDEDSSENHHIDKPSSSDSHHYGVCRQAFISKNGTLLPSNLVSQKTTNIFTKMIHPQGFSWKKVPEETENIYFKELKKEFTWNPEIEVLVRNLWDKKASIRYKDLIHKFKFQKHKENPNCISAEAWPTWLAYWQRKDLKKKKSDQASKNRLNERNGLGISKHRGGSRCANEHALAFAKERNVDIDEISDWDVFLKLHDPKGDGSFIDEKSKLVVRDVHIQAEEQQSQSDQPADMTSIFLEVGGGLSKKGRIFGLVKSIEFEVCIGRMAENGAGPILEEHQIEPNDMWKSFWISVAHFVFKDWWLKKS
ncbi:hypothetical protein C2S52_007249 [Perilla frutescens var. hirtella]|nr:hypothetical protein C2S52_007249 [Perilla frutescens var. hirtella]